MRIPWWSLVLAATLLGAGVGAAVAAAGTDKSKAEANVVVEAAGGPAAVRPLLANVRELATSSLLAGNVDSTLRLPGSAEDLRKRLHASIAPGSQVVVLGVSDSNGDRARQIAQESAVVLTQLVRTRFRTPPLTAAVLDPAHVVSRHGRHFPLDVLIGAVVGLGVSAAALAAMRRGVVPVPAPSNGKLDARERKLEQRIALVTRRERELAKRAGELAKREAEVDRKEAAAAPEGGSHTERDAPRVAPAEARRSVAPPVEGFATAVGRNGRWNLTDLERALSRLGDASAERVEECQTYLFFLRDYAEIDGSLPASFDPLVVEVFGELLRSVSAPSAEPLTAERRREGGEDARTAEPKKPLDES